MNDLIPSKHVRLHETILGLGAVVLGELAEARDVDAVWESLKEMKRRRKVVPDHTTLEDMIVAIDFLFVLGAVTLTEKGELIRCA